MSEFTMNKGDGVNFKLLGMSTANYADTPRHLLSAPYKRKKFGNLCYIEVFKKNRTRLKERHEVSPRSPVITFVHNPEACSEVGGC